MKLFDEEFYTDDFDREMIDFILSKGWKCTNESGDFPCLRDDNLLYGTGVNYFWTSSDKLSNYLTKQQFQEKIGMIKKQFTKADLKNGMFVVYRIPTNGNRVVFNGNLYSFDGEHMHHEMPLSEYRDNLTAYGSAHSWDIMKVIDRDGTVVFVREESKVLSPEQLEIEKIQAEMDKLNKRLGELKEKV